MTSVLKQKKIKINDRHTIILFEDENGKDILYSVGIHGASYLGMAQSDWVSIEE